MASGIAFGHGGVFVLQTPYLLFYPDRDGDDLPDRDPDVLLRGFGMEDAHTVANSLTWGPDGWLYGCQGSTVTANIRGIEFQQGVWRYHPITHRFELFCEGGGNAWGLDFDQHGNLFYSTNYGGFCMVHGVQGGYYWKQFGKHGALHNPYAYGYLEHVPHRDFRGGHVTVGGIVYQGDSFPERYRGKYMAADLLGHNVYWHHLKRQGSTFRSGHGGELLLSNDTWFAPSDVTLGPDGSVYVADWHDKRTAHPDPDAEWDRSRGRVYKIEAKGTAPLGELDLRKLSSERLIALLAHPNDWYVRKARRILADRRDPEVIFPLRTLVLESENDQLALQALWALYVSGGFDDNFAATLLRHRNPDVRRWTVRLLGDDNKVTPALGRQLTELAATEPDVIVRSQLLSTAKRLPAKDGLPIVYRTLLRNLDGQDAHIPLLAWWAVEQQAISASDLVLELFASAEAWKAPLLRNVILERLMRRYAAEGTEAGYTACARLLASAPSPGDGRALLAALEKGLQDRPSGVGHGNGGTLFATLAAPVREPPRASASADALPAVLQQRLDALWQAHPSEPILLCVMARLGRTAAQEQAQRLILHSGAAVEVRLQLLQLLSEVGEPAYVAPLLELVCGKDAARTPEAVQLAALGALQRCEQKEIASTLLQAYAMMPDRLRARTAEILLSRKSWALQLLEAVDHGDLSANTIHVEPQRLVALHRDKQLDQLVRKHWGNIQGERRKRSSRKCAGSAMICGPAAAIGRPAGNCSPSTALPATASLTRAASSVPISRMRTGWTVTTCWSASLTPAPSFARSI